jgi:hypothetical protein
LQKLFRAANDLGLEQFPDPAVPIFRGPLAAILDFAGGSMGFIKGVSWVSWGWVAGFSKIEAYSGSQQSWSLALAAFSQKYFCYARDVKLRQK